MKCVFSYRLQMPRRASARPAPSCTTRWRTAWHAAEQSRPVTLRESAILRLASVHATKAACEAVELAYHAAGSVSLFDASPLQRALRDIHAVRQHMMVADRYRQDVGRVLLGLEPQESFF